jgi:hypothetical protein
LCKTFENKICKNIYFLKVDLILVYLNQVHNTAGFQRMGKTAQKAAVQQRVISWGMGKGGRGGSKATNFRGATPCGWDPFGSK